MGEGGHPRSWLYMPAGRSAVALTVLVVAVGIMINLVRLKQLDPERPDPGIAVAVLGVFAFLGLLGATRGGTRIDLQARQVVRWWGPFFPIWKRRIGFGAIRRVVTGAGMRPGSVQAARPCQRSYHVAVETDRGAVVVRWAQSLADAHRCAAALADAVGCERFDSAG